MSVKLNILCDAFEIMLNLTAMHEFLPNFLLKQTVPTTVISTHSPYEIQYGYLYSYHQSFKHLIDRFVQCVLA